MKKRIVHSLAEPIGSLWRDLQEKYTKQGNFSVASPLSSTPLPIYDWIIGNAHSFKNWDKVKFVLMDEMLDGTKDSFNYVPLNDAASYEGFARKHLLEPLEEKVAVKVQIIKPELVFFTKSFETPIDLLILALGVKGNYANVMPETSEEHGWHIAHLIQEFRKSHTQHGSSYSGANFRDYGMSLGPQQVLQAKHVAVIISGERKRDVTKQLLSY